MSRDSSNHTKNCSKSCTVAARFYLEWTWQKPSGVASVFFRWSRFEQMDHVLEARTTIHVWQWRIHHRSVVVVIVIIKHRTPAVNKSLQARHNHVQGLQQALAKSSLLHYISEFCSLTDWKDKSVISVSRWTDMIWLVRMAMALATQN